MTGGRLRLPRCFECREPIESAEQVDVSLVTFREPLCDQCFAKARAARSA